MPSSAGGQGRFCPARSPHLDGMIRPSRRSGLLRGQPASWQGQGKRGGPPWPPQATPAQRGPSILTCRVCGAAAVTRVPRGTCRPVACGSHGYGPQRREPSRRRRLRGGIASARNAPSPFSSGLWAGWRLPGPLGWSDRGTSPTRATCRSRPCADGTAARSHPPANPCSSSIRPCAAISQVAGHTATSAQAVQASTPHRQAPLRPVQKHHL